jgi:hypothetical protein
MSQAPTLPALRAFIAQSSVFKACTRSDSATAIVLRLSNTEARK